MTDSYWVERADFGSPVIRLLRSEPFQLLVAYVVWTALYIEFKQHILHQSQPPVWPEILRRVRSSEFAIFLVSFTSVNWLSRPIQAAYRLEFQENFIYVSGVRWFSEFWVSRSDLQRVFEVKGLRRLALPAGICVRSKKGSFLVPASAPDYLSIRARLSEWLGGEPAAAS